MSTSSWPTSSSDCASSTPKSKRWSSPAAWTGCSAPGPTSRCWPASTHDHKVNFCKFTNETRSSHRGRRPHAPVNSGWPPSTGRPPAAATSWRWPATEILLVDDRSSTVVPARSRPARRPARHRRPDPAGRQAPRPARPGRRVRHPRRGGRRSAGPRVGPGRRHRGPQRLRRRGGRPGPGPRRPIRSTGRRRRGRARPASGWAHSSETHPRPGSAIRRWRSRYDGDLAAATILVKGPDAIEAGRGLAAGADWWPLRACRELDDAILHLRFNEPELGTWILKTAGRRRPRPAPSTSSLTITRTTGWPARSGRSGPGPCKRLDVSARTLVALIEPGSCFAGTLAELALAADRSFMLDGQRRRQRPAGAGPPPQRRQRRMPARWPTASAAWPPASGATPTRLDAARALFGKDLPAGDCLELGAGDLRARRHRLGRRDPADARGARRLLPGCPHRHGGVPALSRGRRPSRPRSSGGSPPGRTGSLCAPTPSGEAGALRRYGTGSRPVYDRRRVEEVERVGRTERRPDEQCRSEREDPQQRRAGRRSKAAASPRALATAVPRLVAGDRDRSPIRTTTSTCARPWPSARKGGPISTT